MAEGFTSSYNPETGERREHRFEYAPTPPPQPELVSPTQMSETYKYFLSRTNNPKAAIEAANLVLDAAKQYQGRMMYKRAEQEGRLDDRMRAQFAHDMFSNSAQNFERVDRTLRAGQPDQDKAAALDFREREANRPRPMNVGGAGTVYDPRTGEWKVVIPSNRPDPNEATQRKFDNTDYGKWADQAIGAKMQLSMPSISPEARARQQSILENAESEMTKIRGKWQPSTGTATSPPPLSEEVQKTAPASPNFKEGQPIRNKKTGQMGVWRNGKPVPLE